MPDLTKFNPTTFLCQKTKTKNHIPVNTLVVGQIFKFERSINSQGVQTLQFSIAVDAFANSKEEFTAKEDYLNIFQSFPLNEIGLSKMVPLCLSLQIDRTIDLTNDDDVNDAFCNKQFAFKTVATFFKNKERRKITEMQIW